MDKLTVYVKPVGGVLIEYVLPFDATIWHLRQEVFIATGAPPEAQELIIRGKVLPYDYATTLRGANVRDYQLISLVIRQLIE